MKNLIITISIFLISNFTLKAQNLQFNRAIFNEYGPGNGDGLITTPAFTGQLVVGTNQVLKITHANCSTILGTTIQGATPTITANLNLTINDNIIPVINNQELWLPSGTYVVKLIEVNSYFGPLRGIISGVLYDIVP